MMSIALDSADLGPDSTPSSRYQKFDCKDVHNGSRAILVTVSLRTSANNSGPKDADMSLPIGCQRYWCWE